LRCAAHSPTKMTTKATCPGAPHPFFLLNCNYKS
jgi:hypothetical protein